MCNFKIILNNFIVTFSSYYINFIDKVLYILYVSNYLISI